MINAVDTVLLLSMAYTLLRLVDDFSDVPVWLMRGALLALVLLAACAFVFAQPLPALITALMLIYLIGLLLYSAIAFHASRASEAASRAAGCRPLRPAQSC